MKRGKFGVPFGATATAVIALAAASGAFAQNKPPPALNSKQTNEVMAWIGKQVASARQPYCYRDSYGRTAGKALSTCGSGEEKDGALCYPNCKHDYNGVGPVCWQKCPSGFKEACAGKGRD